MIIMASMARLKKISTQLSNGEMERWRDSNVLGKYAVT
jgi:hypothetical protein